MELRSNNIFLLILPLIQSVLSHHTFNCGENKECFTETEICYIDRCVPKCKSDFDCDAGSFCHEKFYFCKEGCRNSNECPFNSKCMNNKCTQYDNVPVMLLMRDTLKNSIFVALIRVLTEDKRLISKPKSQALSLLHHNPMRHNATCQSYFGCSIIEKNI